MINEGIEVSVIVPVYNGEKFIKRCLDSILLQKNISMEVIIVNDGSIDNTESLVWEYSGDTRVRYFSQNNQGVSSARNVGLREASGKYVIFVDADDYLPENTLANRIKNAYGYDLLISGIVLIDDKGGYEETVPTIEKEEISIVEALRSLSPQSRIGYQGFPVNKVFLRELIIANNIFFDVDVAYGEDRLFVGKYLSFCKKILLHHEVVYIYEYNNEGAVAAFSNISEANEKRVITEFEGLRKIEEIVKPFSRSVFNSFRYYEFRQAIRFVKKSEKSARILRRLCGKIILKRLGDSIVYVVFELIPERVFRK